LHDSFGLVFSAALLWSADILSSVRVHPARAVFNWTLANKMPNGPVKNWHYFRNPLADDLVRKVQE